jgi:hypothetical protein
VSNALDPLDEEEEEELSSSIESGSKPCGTAL